MGEAHAVEPWGGGRTLVVIPVFNEEKALPGVLHAVAGKLPACDVLVVDDGSRDGSSRVARSCGVLVATLPFNVGVGGAMRTGFKYALRNGYDRVVQVDGDGQHDPADVPKLLAALDEGADMAIGSRFATGDGYYRVGRVRSGAMGLLRLVVQVLSGKRFTDTSSGFRAFGIRAIELFASAYPQDYMADSVEALLLALYAGLTPVEVPVRMSHRAAGLPSHRNLRLVYHYLRLLLSIMLTLRLRRSPKEGRT